MSYLSPGMRGLGAAVVVVGALGWVSSAQAIISKKRWDPAYGASLMDLGWSGTVDFEIKDDCLATISSSQWVTNLTTGCMNKLSIQSADVTLYELANSSNQVSLSYDDSYNVFAGGNGQLTLRMYVDVNGTEKNLRAVQGGFLFPEFTNASFAKVAGYDAAAYWLNFNANTTNDFSLFSSSAPEGDYAFLTSCSYRTGADPTAGESYGHYKSTHPAVACSQNDGIKYPAVLVPVPEPETYLLAIASFGVLGVWARRRRLRA
ncbi:MAG TPA: PEP-CTERM sorting domain-containing protein [Rubrivivax sp.]|nr:PEP-CTERM sorting domain-containing protein [Rubrivivax sp.]